jgi:gamma-glutamyltranspeptidase/glutathione hydrolase
MTLRRIALAFALLSLPLFAQRPKPYMATNKPALPASHWLAVTGKPLAATAGAITFQKGGNAVDAAVAMTAAACTMWDTLSWGGETTALIYDPHTKKVIGINALGMAPTGATSEFFRGKGLHYPPSEGPLAAVTPGTPGGLLTMLAEYGKLSLKDVLTPAIEMADGYAIEAQAANTIEYDKAKLRQWPYSRKLFLVHEGKGERGTASGEREASADAGPTPRQDRGVGEARGPREGPEPGEIFRQADLAATLRKLVESEQQALAQGKSRKEAIYAAYDRFYKGDIATELARATQEQGGLITTSDLATWKVRIEEPLSTSYHGVDVYKLREWTQGPAMLQALNILENFDLRSMGYNSAPYINTLYQAMSLAFADRDFYYGDPETPPVEPILGLMSKDYAKARAKLIDPARNHADFVPGDPYPFQRSTNPFLKQLEAWPATAHTPRATQAAELAFQDGFLAGTTSVEAADAEGWVVSVTPSGGWQPAVVAGRTGVGLSQRMEAFVTDPAESPFNVVAPGKRPRITLTPTLALKDGAPLLCFSVQGGDSQDQNLLQFFLDVVDFGMNVQQATEAANFNTYQVRSSFGQHEWEPGKILLHPSITAAAREQLAKMGYITVFEEKTSGPINAIQLDRAHGTMLGGSSNYGEDYGIGW